MTVGQQMRALGASFVAPFAIGARTGRVLLLYGVNAIVVVLVLAMLRGWFEEGSIAWLFDLVLPTRVVGFAKTAIPLFIAISGQRTSVLDNAVLSVSLFLLSVLFLPLREKLSATLEDEQKLVDGSKPHASWLAIVGDVVVTTLIIVTAQMALFALGYSRSAWRQELAVVLSYAFLFISCSLDLVPPLLGRQGVAVSASFMALMRAPLLSLGVGFAFSLPGVLAMRAPYARFVIVIVVNIVMLAWGTLAGTVAGARLLSDPRTRIRPSILVRGPAWLVLSTLFAVHAYAFGALALSVEQKSQLLKCDVHLVPSSIGVDLPNALELLSGTLSTKVHVTLQLTNPTAHDVVIENTRLEVARGGVLLGRVALSPGRVPAGQTARYPIEAPVALDLPALRRVMKGRGTWDVPLFAEAAPGLEVPLYVTDRP